MKVEKDIIDIKVFCKQYFVAKPAHATTNDSIGP